MPKLTQERAQVLGDYLAGVLGVGWNAEVWENYGWHYRAQKGCVAVHESFHKEKVSYTVYFNSAMQVVVSGADDPKEAVERAAREMSLNLAKMSADMAVILGAM